MKGKPHVHSRQPWTTLCVRFFALIFIVFATSCLGDMCGNDVIQEAISPDGRMKAVVFVRGCGATTKDYTQVSIIKAGSVLPNKAGNILILNDGGQWSGKGGGKIRIAASWTDDHHLKITAPTFWGNSHQVQEYSGISITYVINPG